MNPNNKIYCSQCRKPIGILVEINNSILVGNVTFKISCEQCFVELLAQKDRTIDETFNQLIQESNL